MDASAQTDEAVPIERLRNIMAVLRGEGGCPWDREQTLETLKPFLVEEAYEVLDAIDGGDRLKLCDELGDLLLQVVFQAQLCREEGSFDFDDVATAISDKLVRRHPHVFGDTEVQSSDDVVRNWDAIKRREHGDRPGSVLDGIPRQLPALLRAEQVQRRAARIGFDWPVVEPVLEKIEEELTEVKEAMNSGDPQAVQAELGDLLFSVVNLSRFLNHAAEEALRGTIERFEQRFRRVEELSRESGREPDACSLEELDSFWEQAKREA